MPKYIKEDNMADKKENEEVKAEEVETQEKKEETKEPKFKLFAKHKKAVIAIIAGLAIVGIGCGTKYMYDDKTNVLVLKTSDKIPVQLEEEKAQKFKAKDLVKSCTGDLTISGKLDSQKYVKQPIDFTYTKGWSTKKKTVNVLVSAKKERPKIKLKNNFMNAQLGDSTFEISDIVKSIKSDKGKIIPLKSKTMVYKKIQKQTKNIAYFQGSDGFDITKEGYYVIHLYAFDENGLHTKASFVVNVTKDKKAADQKIEDIKNNVLDSGTIQNSENVSTDNEIVIDDSGSEVVNVDSPTVTKKQTVSPSSDNKQQNQNTSDTNKENKKDDSTKPEKPKQDAACTPTPAVNNVTIFDDYSKAISAAQKTHTSIETKSDSCGNTIYVLEE